MADSYRLTVLKALCAHLELIATDDFNLSGAVFRGRAIYGEEAPPTMLSLLEAPRPDFPIFGGVNNEARSEEWQLLLQGWTKDDKINPTDPAYGLMDAVEQHLGLIVATKRGSGLPVNPDAYMLGGRITRFSFGPGVVRPPTEGVSSRAFFYLPIKLGLASVVGQ